MKVVDSGLLEASCLHFEQFVLDQRRASLSRDGTTVALRPKAFSLLVHFAENPGRVIGKEELLAAVWPGVVVTDDSLSQCINEVRTALGDRDHRLIKTVPRRGYLFEAVVRSAPPMPNGYATIAAPTTLALATADQPALPPRESHPWYRQHRWLAATALVSATVIGVAGIWNRQDAELPFEQAAASRRSVAVMPFVAVGPESRDYFVSAVTDDVISAVARLPYTWVIAQASAAAVFARETDVRRIGEELGVRYVLTGTVHREGAAVQVTAQFASTDTGVVFWSERFEYPTPADWTWQQDVGMRIARTLDTRMTFPALTSAEARGKRLDAVDAIMQGEFLLRRSAARADLTRARALFEQALAVEPDSIRALCSLTIAHTAEVRHLISSNPEMQTNLAAQAVERALSLAPHSARAHYALGDVLHIRGDLEGALRAYQTAVEIDPSNSWAHLRVGVMKHALGRLEEVPAHMAIAKRLNPLEGSLVGIADFVLGMVEFHLGNDEAAYEWFRKAGAAHSDLIRPWVWMSAIDALHGRTAQSSENLDRALRLRPELTIASFQAIQHKVPRVQAGYERLAEGMRKAGLPE